MKKRAVVLAGGRGTRLRPYTVVLPKLLMPVGDYPILEVVIRQLARHGFDHITMAVNHQADLIRAFFGDGSKWRVRIDYSLEDQPLGTMGPLRLIPDLPAHFLLMNGDVLTDLNYADFHDEHATNNRLFTISSHRREQHIDYGVLVTGQGGMLEGFHEKPTTPYEVSMGVYMVSRDVLPYLPATGLYGFDNLMRDLLKARQAVHVRRFDGYWLDIGRADDYIRAIEEFPGMKHAFSLTSILARALRASSGGISSPSSAPPVTRWSKPTGAWAMSPMHPPGAAFAGRRWSFTSQGSPSFPTAGRIPSRSSGATSSAPWRRWISPGSTALDWST